MPSLVEVGLAQCRARRQRKHVLPDSEVSFWYIANRLGQRFLNDADRRLTHLESRGEGLWRGGAVGFSCYIVGTVDLPVDDSSLPLHILAIEPHEKVRQVGEFVIEAEERLNTYGGAFATLHPIVGKELNVMAKSKRSDFPFDLRPVVEWMGLDEFIEMVGEKRVLREIGQKRMLEELRVDEIIANLPPAKLRELRSRLSSPAKNGGQK